MILLFFLQEIMLNTIFFIYTKKYNHLYILYIQMAYYSDYTFNSMSRIGNDECSMAQRDMQNSGIANYNLQNYFTGDTCMNRAKNFATSTVGMNYSGTYGLGVNGCNVDDLSKLTIGQIQSHPRSKIDLFSRPYVSVPYLGRGRVDPVLEAQMFQGETSTNRKTVLNMSEKSYLKYSTVPLIPEVKRHIQNTQHIIESDISNDWIRGGIQTKNLRRDTGKNSQK